MSTQIVVPALGESVSEATVAKWFKQVGDVVAADEPIVELETDKVTVEVNAPASGMLAEIVAAVGATVDVGAVLGAIGAGGAVGQGQAGRRPRPRCPKRAAAAPAARAGDRPPAPSAPS